MTDTPKLPTVDEVMALAETYAELREEHQGPAAYKVVPVVGDAKDGLRTAITTLYEAATRAEADACEIVTPPNKSGLAYCETHSIWLDADGKCQRAPARSSDDASPDEVPIISGSEAAMAATKRDAAAARPDEAPTDTYICEKETMCGATRELSGPCFECGGPTRLFIPAASKSPRVPSSPLATTALDALAVQVRLPLLDLLSHPDVPGEKLSDAKLAFEKYVAESKRLLAGAAQGAGTAAVTAWQWEPPFKAETVEEWWEHVTLREIPAWMKGKFSASHIVATIEELVELLRPSPPSPLAPTATTDEIMRKVDALYGQHPSDWHHDRVAEIRVLVEQLGAARGAGTTDAERLDWLDDRIAADSTLAGKFPFRAATLPACARTEIDAARKIVDQRSGLPNSSGGGE